MALFLQLIALGLRRELKRVPTLRRLVHALRRSRWELNAVKHGMFTRAGHALARGDEKERISAQATFDRTGPDSARPEDLLARLEASGLTYTLTPDAIHVPSQPGLDSVFGDAVEQYPSDSAFRLT